MAYKERTNEKSTLNKTAAISALGAIAATAIPRIDLLSKL